MALTLTLDPTIRLILEPGYFQTFSAYTLARYSQPADTISARQLWSFPGSGVVMLKPLQLQDDFLNHAAQRTSGCLLRNATNDYTFNAADLAAGTIFEADVGTSDNPWIFHTPASPTTSPALIPVGPTPFYSLTEVANTTEMSMTAVFASPPGTPQAGGPTAGDIIISGSTSTDLRLLGTSRLAFTDNQGFLFRWYYPNPQLTPHQTIYGFSFGQFLLICRATLVEIFRDVSVAQDKSIWALEYKANLFATGSGIPSPVSPNWSFGQALMGGGTGEDRHLMVIPYHRNRVLILASTGAAVTLTVRNDPQLLLSGDDYDITHGDFIYIWALTGSSGRFQVQKIKYAPGPATLNLPPLVTEYTPASPPALLIHADVFHAESLLATLENPILYTFPTSTTSNDCPPATADGTGQSRTYGVTLTFGSSPDQSFSPQFYSVDIEAPPQFMDNPATPKIVQDVDGDSRVMSAEISFGLTPGQGHMTAHLLDVSPGYPLAPYYDRSEMPVELKLNGTTVFLGYTDRTESVPLRQTGTPWSLTMRAADRWILLEQSFLRDQRDYSGVGHITTVDKIVRQCGVDTGSPPGMLAEYPAGWDGVEANDWDTALGTPILNADNLEGNQLLGWKPQILDTGANFIKRIADFYSGWIMGFRSNGNFFYLPYDYFTSPTAVFSPVHTGSAPYYRNLVEHRPIEPSGNVVQVISRYTVDLTSNKSGLFVDFASVRNPAVVNYLGRYKWHLEEVAGSFSCPQLNAMAYIVFKSARRRRKRISFNGDFVPGLELGHAFTVTGYGDYRLVEFRGELLKSNWETCTYVGEKIEKGYGLP